MPIQNDLTKIPREHMDYLGDGVYALFDGLRIWLHANDHLNPTDRICLEPEVMEALKRFDARVHEPAKPIGDPKPKREPKPLDVPDALFSRPPSTCKGCGAKIWWWKNPKTGASTPVTAQKLNHFVDCPKRQDFRKEKP